MSRVEEIAKSVLDAHWDGELPVNPTAIAYKLGVSIVYDTDMKASGRYDIVKGKPVIYVNPFESQVRQRFTIFHELGHCVLGHGPAMRDQSRRGYDAKERDANMFAAAMIIPEGTLTACYESGKYSFHEMADAFGVSYTALSIRMERQFMLTKL